MNELIQQINKFAQNYLQDKQSYSASKENPSWKRLINALPLQFKEAGLNDSYKIKGSIGITTVADIPWLCFFDTDITNSAQKGFYVVLLFRSDMKGFYLSLNQGWTQYQNKYGTRKGKKQILKNAHKAQNILRSISDVSTQPIDLAIERFPGKGYELGNICSIYYSFSKPFSDKKLLSDLYKLLGLYRELKGLVGTNILNINSTASEEDYQTELQTIEPKKLSEGPVEKKQVEYNTTSKKYLRNPAIAKEAILESNFQCVIDSTHSTFTSAATGQPYVEAHHIIPMEFQNDFEYSLDVPENIASLCPNCHTKIHKAKFEEKESMIDTLYSMRSELLKKRSISISLEKLKELY